MDTNTSRMEGARLRADELQCAVQSMPFFGEKRLVIIDGLLGRFEAREKRGAVKKSAKPPKEGETDLYKTFAELINSAPPSSEIVLLDGEVGKANTLLKELSPKADIRLFSPLKGIQLENWARKRVEMMGGKISEDALKSMVRLVGSDLWIMHGEIQKLALYAADRAIETSDVQKLVGLSREASIFTLVDAIIEGRLSLANQSMNELLDTGSAPSYILVMLARQLRLLVRAKDLKNAGNSESAVQSALGLADFPFRKTLDQASRYSMSRLRDFYHRLLDTDVSIKTGKYDDELALTILISELCSQAK